MGCFKCEPLQIGVWNMSQNLHGKVSAQIMFPTAICVQKNRQFSAGERTVKARAGKQVFYDTTNAPCVNAVVVE
jgi:hypothetical protein